MGSSTKQQSAMEYLMTYGWAILAIAIVMVSLYSLGIFNTGSLQPTATPGSCEVVRTDAQVSLAGQCGNLIPKYVAQFNSGHNVNVTIPDSGSLNPRNQITFSAWIYLRSITTNGNTYQYVLCKTPNGAGGSYCLVIISANRTRSYITLNGTLYYPQWDIPPSLNQWAFVTVTYNGSKISAYFDGSLLPSPVSYTGTITEDTNPLIIGQQPSSNATRYGYPYAFNGSIANLQIYNTSLDAASIKALYQEGIGGTPIDLQYLVGWWPLNGNANDYSGNNNQGTINNVVWNADWQSGYSAPTT